MFEVDKGVFAPLLDLPVAVNCQLGDPFQPNQWADSRSKLEGLTDSRHRGPVALFTKSVVTRAQLEALSESSLDLWLFLSITGLGENKRHTVEDVAAGYLAAASRLAHVVVNIQPVIPDHNDRLAALEPVLSVAAQGQGIVVMRGFLDRGGTAAPYREDARLSDEVRAWCGRHGVRLYGTTGGAVRTETAEVRPTACAGNADRGQGNEVLRRLGYPLPSGDEGLAATGRTDPTPYDWTRGDRNFAALLWPACPPLPVRNETSLLSIGQPDRPLHCTSSWFSWARQVPCSIGCWYCAAAYDEAMSRLDNMGCNPSDLPTFLAESSSKQWGSRDRLEH
jgi:hypothetical protein